MSKGYRDGAFALGLVVGGGIALNLFLWLDYSAKNSGDQPSNENGGESGSQVGQYWDTLVRTFVSPSDTLAQWIMAVFTIGVVFLVWRTLVVTQGIAIDTRKGVHITREIGQAQSRAYLATTQFHNWTISHNFAPKLGGFEGNEPIKGEWFIYHFSFEISNTGNSPAVDLVAEYRVTIFYNGNGKRSLLADENCGYLTIGSVGVGKTTHTLQLHDPFRVAHQNGITIDVNSGGLFVSIRLIYRDIFGRHHAATDTFRKDSLASDRIRKETSKYEEKPNDVEHLLPPMGERNEE